MVGKYSTCGKTSCRWPTTPRADEKDLPGGDDESRRAPKRSTQPSLPRWGIHSTIVSGTVGLRTAQAHGARRRRIYDASPSSLEDACLRPSDLLPSTDVSFWIGSRIRGAGSEERRRV